MLQRFTLGHKTLIQMETCTPVFIAALFTIDNIQKQLFKGILSIKQKGKI